MMQSLLVPRRDDQTYVQLLVVEDNPPTLKMLAFLLSNEGYTVHAVCDGASALELLKNEFIDLIVLDLMLPDINGLQVCRAIRKNGLALPVLVLSAIDNRDEKVAALNEGADDYMTKPFDPAEVVARVHSLIRRTQPTMAPHLQTLLCLKGVCLDVRNQVLRAEGTDRATVLTKMEAQLLHVMMRNAGQVVSHSMLISEAWGIDYDAGSNQLEVYVHRLRSKLRHELPNTEFIRTIQGRGYEFVGEGELKAS
jgi:two-component system alkaline phosphatase synthesis response regulator PhoP